MAPRRDVVVAVEAGPESAVERPTNSRWRCRCLRQDPPAGPLRRQPQADSPPLFGRTAAAGVMATLAHSPKDCIDEHCHYWAPAGVDPTRGTIGSAAR